MHRILAFLFLPLLVSVFAGCASVSLPGTNTPAKAPVVVRDPSQANRSPNQIVRPVPQIAEVAPALLNLPYALILPLKSASFGGAAETVRMGFFAAATSVGLKTPTITVYSCDDKREEVLSCYAEAIKNGAKMIIGPLTKDGVTAVAESGLVVVPTLALNVPETTKAIPALFYSFTLGVEAEARQVAKQALDEDHRDIVIVSSGTPLAKRMQQAFQDEWEKRGGKVIAQIAVTNDLAELSRLRQNLSRSRADSIFLAMDGGMARQVRPYLNHNLTTYATSHVFDDKNEPNNIDLNNVHFVDMPWLLQPDHPAVMIFPHSTNGLTPEFERLYALGIDAFRLALEVAKAPLHGGVTLDGVTGNVSLGPNHQFVRTAIPATFFEGKAIAAEPPK